MKPLEARAPRPSFARVIAAMLRLAGRTQPWLFGAYLLSSAAFTAIAPMRSASASLAGTRSTA